MGEKINMFWHHENGSAYIELAIMMPILLFMLFGIIEAAFVASADNTLVSVVDYGIRAMAVNGGMDGNIEDNINRLLQQRGIDSAKAIITGTGNPVQFNNELYLKIEYPYRFQLFGPVGDNLDFRLNLTADSYAISEKYFR